MHSDMNWLGTLRAKTDRPEAIAGEWKWLLGICLLSWAVACGLRLLDLGFWSNPGLMVNGEHILATHDSYLWLAAAAGVRETYLSVMPEFANAVAAFTGMSLGEVGFWMPAVLAGAVGAVCALWGWTLGGTWAGVAAGVFGANIPGFFYRTRLGYYDTDLFILFFPLLTALVIGIMLHGRIGNPLLPARDDEKPPLIPDATLPLWAVGLGILVRAGTYWHADVLTMSKLLVWGGAGLVLVFGVRGRRSIALQALALLGISAFVRHRELGWLSNKYGVPFNEDILWWFGLVIAGAIAVALWRGHRRGLSFVSAWWGTAVLFVVFFILGNHVDSVSDILHQLTTYLKPVADDAPATTTVATTAVEAVPVWPSITQSVVEARAVEWGKVLQRLGFTPWLAVAGCIGYAFVAFLRPVALLLAPLLALGLAGGVLGIRFTMFGGPVVALGLGVPLAWAIRCLPDSLPARRWFEPVGNALVAVLLLAMLVVDYNGLRITPVLDKPIAEAYAEARDTFEENARLWGWWDYGYAAQYYGGVRTVTDGGDHAGKVIYPEALAMTTDSFRLSTQVMKYSALHDYKPWMEWAAMPASEVASLLEGMKLEEAVQGAPPQYVAVNWQMLNIMGWMSFYGTWDVEHGEGTKFSSRRLRKFRLDPRGFVITDESGKGEAISSVDLLDGGSYKNKYFGHKGPHLIVNKARRDAYLMDDRAYDTVLVQLLVGKPDQGLIGKYFELVVDKSPFARIYKVR